MGTYAYFSDTETSTGNTFTAGSIDLKIDNHCWYNGVECYCESPGTCCWDENGDKKCDAKEETCTCTWELTDLSNELFFNFKDLKPGDWGEDTVSLHVYNNDAWACVYLEGWTDKDNTCVDPEIEAEGENNCAPDNEGELAENLEFAFWWDEDGDNVYEPDDGEWLFGDINTVEGLYDDSPLTIVDSVYRGWPLKGSTTYHIGKVWCFGKLSWDDTNKEWICDGSGIDNKPQTDKVTATITFVAEQYRNNENFKCSDLQT